MYDLKSNEIKLGLFLSYAIIGQMDRPFFSHCIHDYWSKLYLAWVLHLGLDKIFMACQLA
jgi:hypothetical protein